MEDKPTPRDKQTSRNFSSCSKTHSTFQTTMKDYIIEINKKALRGITLGQDCLDQGFILRNEFDIKLCSNPKSTSCRTIDDPFKKTEL